MEETNYVSLEKKKRVCVSGRKNSSKLAAAGFTFTGRKVILPAVCQCKVYCNDHFSGVDVRKAAGAPKENSGSGFQSSRGVVDLHKQIMKQKRLKGDVDELSGRVAKYKAEHIGKTCKTNTKKWKVQGSSNGPKTLAFSSPPAFTHHIKVCQRR